MRGRPGAGGLRGLLLTTLAGGVAVLGAAAAPAQPPPQRGSYDFTRDFVAANSEIWKRHLGDLTGRPGVRGLEIGSFEGKSALWFLAEILTHPTAQMTTIDVFFSAETEKRFDHNVEVSGLMDKVVKLKGDSKRVLRALKPERYDFVYIDGSHVAKDVLVDAVLSWDLLKIDGVLIFDDYRWGLHYPPSRRPEIAIDAFLSVFGPYVDVLHKERQVIVRKNSVTAPWNEPSEP